MIGITNAGGRPVNAAQLRLFCQPSTPTNPRNGDIFVVSSVPFSGCEITPYNIQPGRVDQAENGYVFININGGGNTYEHGAWLPLTKNPIIALSAVFTSVLQKINGTYKMVTAYIYINGWHQISAEAPLWDGTLFYNGDQYAAYTGGWVASGGVNWTTSPNLHYINEVGTIYIRSNWAVNFDGHNTLKFTGSGQGANSGGSYAAHAGITDNAYSGGGWLAHIEFQSYGTYAIDCRSITGTHYIQFWASGSREQYLNINKVWFE